MHKNFHTSLSGENLDHTNASLMPRSDNTSYKKP